MAPSWWYLRTLLGLSWALSWACPGHALSAGRQAGSAYDVTGAVVVAIDMHFARQAIVQLNHNVSEVRIRLHGTLLKEHVEQLRQVEPQLATSRHAEASAIIENTVQWESKYEEKSSG